MKWRNCELHNVDDAEAIRAIRKYCNMHNIPYETSDAGYNLTHFEIYCDDELVYTSPGLSTEDFPVEFDVDISGCQKMEINLPGETGYHMLADVELVQELLLE